MSVLATHLIKLCSCPLLLPMTNVVHTWESEHNVDHRIRLSHLRSTLQTLSSFLSIHATGTRTLQLDELRVV